MFKDILSDYVEEFLPELYQANYNFIPAKSSDFEPVELKKFTDQSLFSHIINGLYAVTRIIEVLAGNEVLQLTKKEYKKLLVAYTLHDLHKIPEIETPLREDFNIPLAKYKQKLQELGLDQFIDIKPELCRAVSIHINTRSRKGTADFSKVNNLILRLGRLADGLASSNTLEKALQNRKLIQKIINNLDLAQRVDLEFHRLEEYRGVSTNIIHQVTSEILKEKVNLYPLLYFPDGIVYLKLETIEEIEKENLVEDVVNNFFEEVDRLGKTWNGVQGTYKPTYNKFEDYALLFGGPEKLMEEAENKFIGNYQSPGFAKDLVNKRVGKYCDSPQDFEKKFAIDLSWDEDEDTAKRWGLVQRALAVTKSIARFYLPKEDVDQWLIEQLGIDYKVYKRLKENMDSRYFTGFRYKEDCLVYAYHFLETKSAPDGRSLFEVPIEEKLQTWLLDTLVHILNKLDSISARMEYINESLGMKSDLKEYLHNNLEFSFIQEPAELIDVFKEYSRKKSGSHKRLCVLCNRYITKKISKNDTKIKSGIIEDSIQTFSNRIIPKSSDVSAHVWCPICYLEFMLRQVLDLGFAPNADKNNSQRIYLFLFPDYFFTPDLLADSADLLAPFREKTSLKVRKYGGEETTFSEIWLNRDDLPKEWLKEVNSLFHQQAEQIKERNQNSDRRKFGEYISTSPVEHKNFHLLSLESSVSDNVNLKQKPTEIEMIMKAIMLGGILQNLLGVRVYISKTPYLNSISNHEFKTALKLDSIHNSLRKILPEISLGKAGQLLGEIPLSSLNDLLNIWSSLWMINNQLNERDKEIANLLSELNRNDLAGAHFYKRYEQEKEYIVPSSMKKAVELLLSYFGGEKMNLAQEIAEKSFNLYRPSSRRDGKAHRYEDLFRTTVEGIKEINTDDREEIVSRLAGKLDKRLQRLSEDQGYVCNYDREEIEGFVQFIVEELFVKRCNQSYAELEQEVNSLADGVYFETDKLIQKFWEEKEDN